MGWRVVLSAVVVVIGGCTVGNDAVEDAGVTTSAAPVVVTSSTVTSEATTSTAAVTSAEPSMRLQYGLRLGDIPRIAVRWEGLPEAADSVTMTWSSSTAARVEPVVNGLSAFEITKPSWTRYAVFTAFDVGGGVVAVEEVVVDGGSCSAGRQDPTPSESDDLPSDVDAARVHLLERVGVCGYVSFEQAAVDGGVFFGVDRDDVAAQLKELDQRQGIMNSIRSALRGSGSQQDRDGQSVYVFTSQEVELVLNTSGELISASA